ncbi:MAG: PQQ-binding-like beta-propeller repeat protein [Verrucomicrobiota bacterium]
MPPPRLPWTRTACYVCYSVPARYVLVALDHSGKTVWERNLGPFVSQHGCGASPMLYEDKVILGNEQDGVSFILAVDAKTGKTRWQTPRNSEVAAYATPCVYQPKGGKPQLLFTSQAHGIYALEPDTGNVIWEYTKAFDKRSVSCPVFAGDIVFGSCGSGGGGNFVTAVRAGDPASGKKAELAYQMKRSAPYVPTSVVVGDLIWMLADVGILTCLHTPTGEIRYQERVGGDFFGSPVWVDGRLFCITKAGEVVVIEASDKFNILSRYPLGELTYTTPAVAGGRMYIRTEKHLLSVGGKTDQSTAALR